MLKGVVSASDDIDPAAEQLVSVLGCEAAATRAVFAVSHDVVERELRTQGRDGLDDCLAPAVADDIAEEEEPHGYRAYSVARVSRTTVTLIWPGYSIVSSIFWLTSRA